MRRGNAWRGWGVAIALAAGIATAPGIAAAGSRPVLFSVGPLDVLGDQPYFLTASAGVWDFRGSGGDRSEDQGPRAEVRSEFLVGKKILGLAPLFGFLVNDDGAFYGYWCAYTDFSIGNLHAMPMMGFGGYHRGDGKEMGGPFLFHLGGTISYELENQMRLGVTLTHLSHAYIYEENPGEESLMLTVYFPLDIDFY